MHPDYFEGILQLRKPAREVVSFVERYAPHISKVKKEKNGYDYYFISQRVLRALGHTLQKRFTGELKTSRKLHTRNRQTGKPVYRVTVLFRCYDFKKGNWVKVKGELCTVLAKGKKVYVQNSKTKKKQWVSYDLISN